MATSRFAKVTASSIIVLAASTSGAWVSLLEKGSGHAPQLNNRKPSSRSTHTGGPFVREISQAPSSSKTQSVALSSFSSYVSSLKRSVRSIWSPTSDSQMRHSSSSEEYDVSDMVKSLQNRFRVGDYYVWLYKDSNNQSTSWEKYSIVNVDDDGVVVIHMSTKFSDEEDFVTHHRITVNLADNLKALDCKDSWRLCGFEYRDCEVDDEIVTVNWKQLGIGENVQAFEEKFDIFNMLRPPPPNVDSSGEETRMVKLNRDIIPLVRTNRHGYTKAWYASPEHDQLSGIAVLKDFEEHSFSLIESGRDGADPCAVDVDSKEFK